MMDLYVASGDHLIVRAPSIYTNRNNCRMQLEDCTIYRLGSWVTGFWRDKNGTKWTTAAKYACESGDALRQYHSIGPITISWLRDQGFIDPLHN